VPHSLRGLPPGGVMMMAIAIGRTAINTPKRINQRLAFGFSVSLFELIYTHLSQSSNCSDTNDGDPDDKQ